MQKVPLSEQQEEKVIKQDLLTGGMFHNKIPLLTLLVHPFYKIWNVLKKQRLLFFTTVLGSAMGLHISLVLNGMGNENKEGCKLVTKGPP